MHTGGIARMKRTAMTAKIRLELDHIPRAERGSAQNELRMLYWLWRSRDLARDPEMPATRALDASVITLRELYPYFQPQVDHEFFGIGGELYA